MELKTFLQAMTPAERESFASKCGTSWGHLRNVMYGDRPCATDLAVSIERESRFVVRRWDLRPSDWHRHWPELVSVSGAPALADAGATPLMGEGAAQCA